MCYCEHCRENFHAATGMDLPRTTNPHDPSRRAYMGWRQQRLFELWRLWDGEIRKINPAARYIPNSGGGATARSRHEDHRRTGAHPLRRPAGAQRRHASLGQRKERQGVPLHHGREAHRRHLQRRRGRAVPLEGLGAERAGDPPVGARRNRQRPAPLVHQVLRLAVRQALAAGGGRPLRLALSQRALSAQRAAAGARRHGLFAADLALLRRPAGAPEGGGPHARLLPGADRSAHSLRDGARSAARRRAHRSSSRS